MPLGIISESDYNKEVISSLNRITPARSLPIIELDKDKGRNNKSETPDSIRSVIAQEALLGVSAKEIAREYNVSQSSISAYKKDATSTTSYNKSDKSLRNRNSIFRDRIVRKSSRIALTALDSIDSRDFETASLTDKARVAKEMASIVRDMSGSDNDESGKPIAQIIIHAPQMRTDKDYIDIISSVD